jgi:pimeloyl-ACP methyl ester carboxylesterase
MVDRRRLAGATGPAGAALLLVAWMAQAQQEPGTAEPFTQPEFVESPCPWPDRAHGAQIDCGYLSVPEDRAKPGGNVIRLAVARLRGSVRSRHPDPVIYLAGGPGESVVQRTHRFVHDARFIWEERDLILLDPRGVGRSEPRLECPDYQGRKAELRKLDLDPGEALRREVDALLACKRTLSEEGIDVSAYSPQAVAADVADLAAAMGYETYNLYGRGFGTMLALTVMRDFPEKPGMRTRPPRSMRSFATAKRIRTAPNGIRIWHRISGRWSTVMKYSRLQAGYSTTTHPSLSRRRSTAISF